MALEQTSPLSWISFAFPGLAKIRCAFQVRHCGAQSWSSPFAGGNISFAVGDDPADVQANRSGLVRALGLSRIAELNQIHSDRVVFDPQEAPLEPDTLPPVFPDGDGLATSEAGLGLLIRTADCQPLLLAHERQGHIAAFHVGWRGNRMEFPASGVRAFCAQYQLRPEELLAVRGPSLGPAKSEFVNFEKEWGDAFLPWYTRQTQTMNLWKLTCAQLVDAGLHPDRIFSLDLCTASLPEMFFSYRRDRKCGRQASLIWIAP